MLYFDDSRIVFFSFFLGSFVSCRSGIAMTPALFMSTSMRFPRPTQDPAVNFQGASLATKKP